MHRLVVSVFAFAMAVACFSAAVAQTTSLPAPLAQAIAATQSARESYAFEMELRSGSQAWRTRFDPTASPRLRLVEGTREAMSREARAEYDQLARNLEGVFWCASDELAGAQDVRLLREDEATATYAFRPSDTMLRTIQAQPAPRPRSGGAAPVRLDRRGELTVSKQDADVTRLRLYAAAPFRPIPFVTVQRMNVTLTCAPAPNGRRYAADIATDARVSAFGFGAAQNTVRRSSNLAARP